MASLLQHFDVLSNHGFEVIPLNPGEKSPIFPNWQTGYYNINRCRSYIENNPDCNLGLRLGSIIDVEGDSLHANRMIAEMIGDYPHPSYQSRKSIHHIFINPINDLTRIVYQNIEFRGHRHQSVLPPSIVEETKYKWITVQFPIPPMPNRLHTFLENIRRKKNFDIKPNHMKLPCGLCRNMCYLHKQRFKLEIEIFRSMGLPWTCHKCRVDDLRPQCRKLRKNKQLQQKLY